jgi:putative ABC transport system substrate-binding protein
MRRREVIAGLALMTAAWPLAAHAQSAVRRIGFLTPRSRPTASRRDAFTDAFVSGMHDLGYDEGANLAVEWRFANGRYDILGELAAELVRLDPEVIVAYGTAAAQRLQRATGTVPVVVAAAVDLVGSGLVASLARPGGNITGLSAIGVDLSPKHLELLQTIKPKLARVAVLVNPGNSVNAAVLANARSAAREFGIEIVPAQVRAAEEIEPAFVAMSEAGAQAAIVATDAFFSEQGEPLAAASSKHRIPTISIYHEHAAAGCLIVYGQNIAQFHRLAATYVDKILRGRRPAELPVEQPTKFELVINLKTANTLGLTIPTSLLARTDEVIE